MLRRVGIATGATLKAGFWLYLLAGFFLLQAQIGLHFGAIEITVFVIEILTFVAAIVLYQTRETKGTQYILTYSRLAFSIYIPIALFYVMMNAGMIVENPPGAIMGCDIQHLRIGGYEAANIHCEHGIMPTAGHFYKNIPGFYALASYFNPDAFGAFENPAFQISLITGVLLAPGILLHVAYKLVQLTQRNLRTTVNRTGLYPIITAGVFVFCIVSHSFIHQLYEATVFSIVALISIFSGLALASFSKRDQSSLPSLAFTILSIILWGGISFCLTICIGLIFDSIFCYPFNDRSCRNSPINALYTAYLVASMVAIYVFTKQKDKSKTIN